MRERVIEVRGLRRSYDGFEAVRGVDLSVDRGEVFALLGPNGAGKTTTTEILEGYRSRSGGEVTVLGHDPARGERALRERVGIVLQETGVERYLTVRETAVMYAGLYPHPRDVDEVLLVAGLDAQRDVRVHRLSGGQRRRLDVAIALVGDPELLFLDEPTTGFDPSARRNAWDLVKELATLGKTVFLTTHFMDEAQALADRVAVLARGLIVAEGPPSTLAGRHHMQARVRFRAPEGAPVPPDWGQRATGDDVWEIATDDPTSTAHALTGWALEHGLTLPHLEISTASLEDVYLELTEEA